MGRLDVRVVECRNLPQVQSMGEIDPYVKLELDNKTHKTSVVENKSSPAWNEVFKFIVADADSAQLKVEVWNSNVASDDFLGCYNVSLSGLKQGEVKDEWYILNQCKSNAEIHLRILAVDFGDVPEQAPEQPVCAPAPVPVPAPAPAPVPVQPAPVAPMPPPAQPPAPAGYGAPGGYGQPPACQPAPVPQPVQQPPPPAGYGAPTGYGAPAAQPQWGAGGTAAQPQWGTTTQPVPGQVVNQNASQKQGGGVFGAVGGFLSGAAKVAQSAVDTTHKAVNSAMGAKHDPVNTGGSNPPPITGAAVPAVTGVPVANEKKALWVNKADGFVFVTMDGTLRHVPDPNVFASLFHGTMSDHSGMNTFNTAPGNPPVPFPFGKPIPGFAHIKSCNGEFYFIDEANGAQVRRHLNQGAFHNYSFVAGQNMRPMTLQELQAMPQGPPLS